MFECLLPDWVSVVIDWYNNGIIDENMMGGILKYFYIKGYCVEVDSV